MEDLNTRTESVIGDSTDDAKKPEYDKERIVVGDHQMDDEPEELKEEQQEEEEPEPLLEPDDPE